MEDITVTHQIECLNCSQSLEANSTFCNKCGQKTKGITLEFKSLIAELWESIFNLDNTFFKSLRYFWAPWKLTRFYVEGKRKSFLNPVRLFLVCLLLHFGVLTSLISLDNKTSGSLTEFSKLERSKLYEKHLNFLNTYENSTKDVCIYADSLNRVLFDKTEMLKETKLSAFEGIKWGRQKYNITLQDAIDLKPEDLYKKYEINTWWGKLIVKQIIRLNLDRAGALKYVVQNVAWGIIPVLLILALFFKLLYYRRNKYYTEHLVFLMNLHSFAFMVVSVCLLTFSIFSLEDELNGIVAFILMVYVYFAFYFYYGQGIIKTFVKYCITGFCYLILVLFFLLIAGVVSLLFY